MARPGTDLIVLNQYGDTGQIPDQYNTYSPAELKY